MTQDKQATPGSLGDGSMRQTKSHWDELADLMEADKAAYRMAPSWSSVSERIAFYRRLAASERCPSQEAASP